MVALLAPASWLSVERRCMVEYKLQLRIEQVLMIIIDTPDIAMIFMQTSKMFSYLTSQNREKTQSTLGPRAQGVDPDQKYV